VSGRQTHRARELDASRFHRPVVRGGGPPPAAAGGSGATGELGTEEHLQRRFGAGAASIRITPRNYNFRYKSPEHCIEVVRTWYGAVHDFNVSRDATMIVPSEYLEVVIAKR
jgi:hypothetical protein